MAIGDLVRNEFFVFCDPDTGARVERLTSPKVTSHLPKQTCRYTSADGTVMLYVGECGEYRQLYAMNLLTGVAVQLTSGKGLCEYECVWLDVDDAHALFAQSGAIWRVNLETLLRERLYECERGWLPQCLTLSGDGRYVLVTEYEHTSVPVSLEETDWSYFALTTIASPHCRIVMLDRKTGERHVVRDERCWLGRASLRPGDPDTVLYCHEGPYDYIDDRMWIVNVDGTDVRCVRHTPPGAVVVGETWAADGSGVYHLYSDEKSRAGGADGGLASICVTDIATLETRRAMDCHLYAHCSGSRDDRWAAGDASDGVLLHLLSKNGSEHPDDYIYLVDIRHWREVRLCHHASSWGAGYGTIQDAHPHPAFSDDCRYLLFTSDRDGHPAIYRVDLARFLWARGRAEGPFETDSPGLPDASWGFLSTFGA